MNKRKLFCLGLALILSIGVQAMDTEPETESLDAAFKRWSDGDLKEFEKPHYASFVSSQLLLWQFLSSKERSLFLKRYSASDTVKCKKLAISRFFLDPKDKNIYYLLMCSEQNLPVNIIEEAKTEIPVNIIEEAKTEIPVSTN